MPVMVVGADTPLGGDLMARLLHPEREVRAFVTDPAAAAELRRRGVKVALGDVSDESHVTAACHDCFSVVLVAAAAGDGRERAFAPDPDSVLQGWARATGAASVRRVIWVVAGTPPPAPVPEVAVVDPAAADVVEQVYDLDAARRL